MRMAVLCGAVLAAGAAAAPVVVDEADLASAPSRAAHAVVLREASIRHASAQLGTLTLPVCGACIAPGGRLSARLKPAPILWITLCSRTEDFGKRQAYSILLDGREAARIDEREWGGGVARSLFLEAHGERTVTVLCDARSESPVTVASIRSCPPLARQTPPMGLALLTRQSFGYRIDPDEMRALIALLPGNRHIVPQTAVLFNFCNRSDAGNAAEMRRLARQAEALNIPLRVACEVQWGGVPSAMADGLSGRLTDLPYQQIVWDEKDITDDPGLRALLGPRWDIRYGLSTPNAFGNTPWLTFNNARLNSLRSARLQSALHAWHAEHSRLVGAGKPAIFPAELGTGDETIYWARGMVDDAYTKANAGIPRSDMMADFNPATVADARRDGVTLDPRDGLSWSERWWLHRNLARQQQRLIDAMLAAVLPEPAHVRRGVTEYAADLVRRNLYTEPYAMSYYPMKDVSAYHPQIEAGYVRNGRSGGEWWSGATMLPWLIKQRERGRVAVPNVECTGIDSEGLVGCLEAAYAMGARYATLYNWKWHATIADLLAAFAAATSAPDGAGFPPGSMVETAPPYEAVSRRFTPGPRAFGVNVVRIYAVGPASARARVTLVNSDGESISVAHAVGDGTFRLPGFLRLRPGRPCTVSVTPLGGPLPLKMAEDGSIAVRLSADISLERSRSLLVEDRQDAADLLDAVQLAQGPSRNPEARAALAQARVLLQNRDYRAAYRAGIRAEQLTLPSVFEVEPPGGRLGPYGVWVTCRHPVQATVTAWAGTSGQIVLRSSVPQSAVVLAFGSAQLVSVRGATRVPLP